MPTLPLLLAALLVAAPVATPAATPAVTPAPAPSPTPSRNLGSGLDGAWTVDLRPTPDAAAYLKPMALTVAADGHVTGEFHQHAIEDGRAVGVLAWTARR